jgi:hypothetical protein
LFTLEYGVPVKHATQAALTAAVAKGIHNIDISLIIAPVVHKFIVLLQKKLALNTLMTLKIEMKAEDERIRLSTLK